MGRWSKNFEYKSDKFCFGYFERDLAFSNQNQKQKKKGKYSYYGIVNIKMRVEVWKGLC